jgi:hypothetical protein
MVWHRHCCLLCCGTVPLPPFFSVSDLGSVICSPQTPFSTFDLVHLILRIKKDSILHNITSHISLRDAYLRTITFPNIPSIYLSNVSLFYLKTWKIWYLPLPCWLLWCRSGLCYCWLPGCSFPLYNLAHLLEEKFREKI